MAEVERKKGKPWLVKIGLQRLLVKKHLAKIHFVNQERF